MYHHPGKEPNDKEQDQSGKKRKDREEEKGSQENNQQEKSEQSPKRVNREGIAIAPIGFVSAEFMPAPPAPRINLSALGQQGRNVVSIWTGPNRNTIFAFNQKAAPRVRSQSEGQVEKDSGEKEQNNQQEITQKQLGQTKQLLEVLEGQLANAKYMKSLIDEEIHYRDLMQTQPQRTQECLAELDLIEGQKAFVMQQVAALESASEQQMRQLQPREEPQQQEPRQQDQLTEKKEKEQQEPRLQPEEQQEAPNEARRSGFSP